MIYRKPRREHYTTIDLAVIPKPGDDGISVEHNYVEHNYMVSGGGQSLGNSWGAGVRDRRTKAEGFADERKALQKALALPHDQVFEFQLGLHFH